MRTRSALGRFELGRFALAGLLAVAVGGCASGTQARLASDSSARAVVSAPTHLRFTNGRVTNPWFPLKPGTRMVYRGVKDGKRARDVVFVTRHTRIIQGVVCRAVRDRLWLAGHLEERTVDWYAQSAAGDVWYFGERTAELDRSGHVTTREGSWLAGRDGARAGVYITAHPRVGQSRQQEFYAGQAADHFAVVSTAAHTAVPLLWTSHAVLTKEWTPLEPNVLDHKYYVRDIGVVREQSVKGPLETNVLVSIRHVRLVPSQ